MTKLNALLLALASVALLYVGLDMFDSGGLIQASGRSAHVVGGLLALVLSCVGCVYSGILLGKTLRSSGDQGHRK